MTRLSQRTDALLRRAVLVLGVVSIIVGVVDLAFGLAGTDHHSRQHEAGSGTLLIGTGVLTLVWFRWGSRLARLTQRGPLLLVATVLSGATTAYFVYTAVQASHHEDSSKAQQWVIQSLLTGGLTIVGIGKLLRTYGPTDDGDDDDDDSGDDRANDRS